MVVFGSLPPAEQARQLANPEGQVGIEVAEWLNGNNCAGNARVLAMLDVQAGHRVLEIGFGNGRAAPAVIGLGAGMLLFNRLDRERFRRVVFAVLLVSGLVLLIRG